MRPGFGFDDVAAVVRPPRGARRLARLPVARSWRRRPGSQHGYDVVDHTRLNDDAGGRPAFDRLVEALHERGLRAVADVVPNHMAVPTPVRLNAALW